MNGRRIAELDGLRGLAAIAVVTAHYFGEVAHGIPALTIGWYSVDFFFVLSGFLMGSIILRRDRENGFLKSFYLRRAARILPVYFLVVLATLALIRATQGHEWSDHAFPAPVYLLFLTNFVMSATGSPGSEWLRPTWTLSVEEQFYLVLPLMIMLTPKRLLGYLLAILFLAAPVFRLLFQNHSQMAALTLLPARMDLLLSGVAVALAMRRPEMSRHLQIFRVIPILSMGALLAIALLSRSLLFPLLSPTLLSAGFSFFLLAALHGAPEGTRYRSPLLRYFGRISFALYLVHQPVSGLMHGLILNGRPDIGTVPEVAVTLLSFALSVALASASWKWVEHPILKRVPVAPAVTAIAWRPEDDTTEPTLA